MDVERRHHNGGGRERHHGGGGDRHHGGGERHHGGGGRFHGRGRKRNFRERGDDDGDHDRRPRFKPRYEEPAASRLRRLILAIAEQPRDGAANEAQYIAKLLNENFEDDLTRKTFFDLVLQAVSEQPLKIPYVAAVILHANETNAEIGKEALERARVRAQFALDSGDWRGFKLVLRFFACLQPMLADDGVFPLLDEVFNRAVDLQTASQEDAVGLDLVKIILLTLPYLLANSPTTWAEKAAELLEKTDIVASAPHPLEPLVESYLGDEDQKPFGFRSFIGLLQKQLAKESENGWELTCLSRPYTDYKKQASEEATAEIPKHALPEITVPSPVNPGRRPVFPETYFSMYADTEIETVPRTDDIAASLIRDATVDTINLLDFNRVTTARFLMEIDCFWAAGTFAKRGTAFDKLKNDEGRTMWKSEDMAVDAIFSQLFALPIPEHKLVYYHAVVTECCKIAPAAVAPSLGRAIRFLFRNIDSMDMELEYRFMDWFAHHLSNFDFRWKWAEWIEDISRPDLHPKKAFLAGILDKEIRLSFAKRVRGTLPKEYHVLVPEGKDKDTPDFKYSSDDVPFAPEARQILDLLKKKAPDSDIQPIIDNIHAQASEAALSDPLVASTDAYMTAVLVIGSKSLSHLISGIERCRERLVSVGPASEAARRQIISSVVDYWRFRPGTAVGVVDKLLNYTILLPESVVLWALGPERLGKGEPLADAWLYEMVSGTLGKVATRVRQIRDALVNARVAGGMPDEQITKLEELLTQERGAMRALFGEVDDSVGGVARGVSEGMLENEADDAITRILRAWGARWARVFRRRAAVEETWVADEAIKAAIEARKMLEGAERRRAEEVAAEEEREEEERVKREEEESRKREEEEERVKRVKMDEGKVEGGEEVKVDMLDVAPDADMVDGS
ncbi:cap binding protein [Eremomyces bilateralis CBS 781.70]|uniref:Cap binding protein n=1 Tax=Eremomyces bilateralis CBS 781.70 TaxID=1392243 RepID=A0A6G1G5K8_9PEZI|nr:cap binding protein [Eremomyces bilateralis CBS 781.70]KAF1813292.1 cap binding protein [Eremomyces bilateralis CBS 781.70]